jgi:hypothetical protein
MAATTPTLGTMGTPAVISAFRWDELEEATRLTYIDPKVTLVVGQRYAWYPTQKFQEQVWGAFLFPKAHNIYNKNMKRIFGRHVYASEIKCYMTGLTRAWKEARPTVIASCTRPKYAQNIINLLARNPIITRLKSGFDFYADPNAADIIRCVTEQHMAPPSLGSLDSLCGARILIPLHGGSGDHGWRHATLGGMLRIENSYFGITAAHAFLGDSNPGSDSGESDDDNDGSYSTHLDGDFAENSSTVVGSDSSFSAPWRILTGATVYLSPATYVRTAQPDGTVAATQVGDSLKLGSENVLGKVAITSKSRQAWFSQEDDWALVEIVNSRFHLPNIINNSGTSIRCARVSDNIPRGPVIAVTGFSGTYSTTSTGRIVGIVLPDSSCMVSAWTIERSSGKYSIPFPSLCFSSSHSN